MGLRLDDLTSSIVYLMTIGPNIWALLDFHRALSRIELLRS